MKQKQQSSGSINAALPRVFPMNNYDKMLDSARRRFLGYDMAAMARRPGVFLTEDHLATRFLGEEARISLATGAVTFPESGRDGGFGECLTLYDWLCDGKPDAKAAGEYGPVSSLPGIYVGGSGLVMNTAPLAAKIDKDPAAFRAACMNMGGRAVPMGDIGFLLPALPGLDVLVKFYRSDEEFPPTLTLLWDKNILHFLRYETVYYLAGCLLQYLQGFR